MIKSIEINECGLIKYCKVNLAPLTFITGYNDTGKLDFLNAIIPLGVTKAMRKIIMRDGNYVNCTLRGGAPTPPTIEKLMPSIIHTKFTRDWLFNAFLPFNGVLLFHLPESFLHENYQAQLGKAMVELITLNPNIQIIFTSYSVTIFNNIRIEIKNKVIALDKLLVYNFTLDDNERTHIEEIPIEKDGNCEHWPKGFFDQMDYDLSELLGWG